MEKNKIIVHMKEEYIQLMPLVTAPEYEKLKRSRKEECRLLVPVVLNQDNVVVIGHHRLQACAELDIPASCLEKDFMRMMTYMVNVNLYSKSLDDFQRAEDNNVLG